MRKKYLSALLFGALVMASTATFTSCKDYDDDIDNLQSQISANADAIKKLQDLVGAGKFVTNVSKVTDGITITWNDGSSTTLNGTDGKDGKDGKDGSVITIGENNNWFIDGKDTGVCAKGEKGDKGDQGEQGPAGENGAAAEAGADGHDAAIIDGYWAVWNAETGAYVKTNFIAGGVRVVEIPGGYKLTINNGDGSEQSIVLPTSAELVSITTVKGATYNSQNLFYGILSKDVDWNGAKAVDGKMLAGMYPVLGNDIQVMLNPTGVDGTLYSFDFQDTDGVTPWGLEVGDIKPYAGGKLLRASSESGIWVLPRKTTRIELNELNERADFATQFKPNDTYSNYAFALCATAADGKVIKSQYIYDFNPYNVSNMNADKFGVTLNKMNYKWGDWQEPDLSLYRYQSSLTGLSGAYLSQVIYDYKLSIDKTKMTQVTIDKYGLEISEDGYTFRCTKEAAVDNTIYLKLDYILVNGSKASTTLTAQIVKENIVIVSDNIGTINEAFNAKLVKDNKAPISALDNKYVLTSALEVDFAEVLGANYNEWIDAMYENLKGRYGNNGQYNTTIANILKDYAYITGGDPINNDATYNQALISNLMYIDYVDENGNSCVYDTRKVNSTVVYQGVNNDNQLLEKLGQIKKVKIFFIAGTYSHTYNTTTNTWSDWTVSQEPVHGSFYTMSGTTEWYDTYRTYTSVLNPATGNYDETETTHLTNGFAIPLNNAFRVQVSAVKEQQAVASYNFTFQLTQPENVALTHKNGAFTKWNADKNYLSAYAAYDADKAYAPMYDSFKWADEATLPQSEYAPYYTLSYTKVVDKEGTAVDNGVKFFENDAVTDQWYGKVRDENDVDHIWKFETASVTMDKNENIANWASNDTYVTFDSANEDNLITWATKRVNGNQRRATIYVNAAYNLFGVYPASAQSFTMEFASLLRDSEIKTKQSVLTTAPGTHGVLITNDDLNMSTPLGGKFFLFDDLNSSEMKVERKTLNAQSFNEDQRSFSTVSEITTVQNGINWFAKPALASEVGTFTVAAGTQNTNWEWAIDPETGVRTVQGMAADDEYVLVSAIPAVSKKAVTGQAYDIKGGHKGGLYIQLPTSVHDGQQVKVTLRLTDGMGFTKDVTFVIQKIG